MQNPFGVLFDTNKLCASFYILNVPSLPNYSGKNSELSMNWCYYISCQKKGKPYKNNVHILMCQAPYMFGFFLIKEYITIMSWLKPLGIVGVGTVIASAIVSEPSPVAQTATVNVPVVPVVEATKKVDVVHVVPKEAPKYVPVAEREKPVVKEAKSAVVPIAKPKPVKTPSCHPGYSGCLKPNAGDYDCAGGSGNGPNYTGAVQVYGSDPFGLDRGHDGWGCE